MSGPDERDDSAGRDEPERRPDGPGPGRGHDDGAGDLRRSSSLVAAGIAASRVAGLVREATTAYFLGTGMAADAFRAALRIPNLLQNLLGEGVLSASFIPAYSQARAQGRHDDAGRLAGAIVGLLTAVTVVLVLAAVFFARPLAHVLVPGWAAGAPEKLELTVTLVRILTPGIGFLVLSAWCLGILNSHRRFFLSYVAPVVWNFAIVAAIVGTALLLSPADVGLAQAMAWGALTGSVLQLAVQLPAVRRLLPDLRLSLHLGAPGVRTVLRRFGQVLAGRGSVQIAGYVDLLLASLLASGAVAALGFAQALYLLPISLFGMATAAAELPTLATMDHADRGRVLARLDLGLGRVAYFVVPSAVAFVLLGDLVVATVYQGNRFTADASAQVGGLLSILALALLASTSSRLLQSSLYGIGDTRTPAIYAVIKVAVSLAIGVTLMLPLDAVRLDATGLTVVGDLGWGLTPAAVRVGDDAFRMGAAGLAIGAVVGAWLELLLLRLRVRVVFGRTRLAGGHGRELAVAALCAAAVALLARTLLAPLALHPRLAGLLALLVTGIAYLAVTSLQRLPEAEDLRRQLWRAVRPGRRS